MRANRITPQKYWSAFGKAYQGPAEQARTIEENLTGLPQKDAHVNIEVARPLFDELQAPWIPTICKKYNIGGIKVLGDHLAPQPNELAHFFSHLLNPSIQHNHFKYPGVLGAGIEAGYIALSERRGGDKRVFKNMVQLTNALCKNSLDMLSEPEAQIHANAFSGKVQFLIDEMEVFPAIVTLDCDGSATSIIIKTGIDTPQLTGRLIDAFGSWDLKFSSGHTTQHVWMNGADRETILNILLGVERPLRLVGINHPILSASHDMRTVVLHEISENIQKITESYSHLNDFMKVFMLMNLGKLKWIESEYSYKFLGSASS